MDRVYETNDIHFVFLKTLNKDSIYSYYYRILCGKASFFDLVNIQCGLSKMGRDCTLDRVRYG